MWYEFTGTGANPLHPNYELHAYAGFDIIGDELHILLMNTAESPALVPSDILTGMVFSWTPGPALTPVSARLYDDPMDLRDAQVIHGPDGGGNVGGEWAYAVLETPYNGGRLGVSSSGWIDAFGQPNFGGTDLSGPTSTDGLQYGIAPWSQDRGTVPDGNSHVTDEPLIRNGVEFTFLFAPGMFSLDDISNVGFQYGTDVGEPFFPGTHTDNPPPPPVPEPLTMVMLGCMGAGMLAARRLRRNSS
ncbi:MAG: hypothetical protein HZB26_11885 [Candidatus Hydrogenedentes bacterium]|nr:hypothetical protein [Candidatus Hydrogenedentota bacterium]